MITSYEMALLLGFVMGYTFRYFYYKYLIMPFEKWLAKRRAENKYDVK